MNNPRYFLFVDEERQLRISGWFEPEQRFPGVKKSWEEVTKLWESVGYPAQDVSFVQIGNWDAVAYETQAPDANNSDIQAHWVQAGTWIHIHISMTSSVESRAKLVAFLQAIHVKDKADSFSRSTLLSLEHPRTPVGVHSHLRAPSLPWCIGVYE